MQTPHNDINPWRFDVLTKRTIVALLLLLVALQLWDHRNDLLRFLDAAGFQSDYLKGGPYDLDDSSDPRGALIRVKRAI